MVTDVAVSDDVVTLASPAPVGSYAVPYVIQSLSLTFHSHHCSVLDQGRFNSTLFNMCL